MFLDRESSTYEDCFSCGLVKQIIFSSIVSFFFHFIFNILCSEYCALELGHMIYHLYYFLVTILYKWNFISIDQFISTILLPTENQYLIFILHEMSKENVLKTRRINELSTFVTVSRSLQDRLCLYITLLDKHKRGKLSPCNYVVVACILLW